MDYGLLYIAGTLNEVLRAEGKKYFNIEQARESVNAMNTLEPVCVGIHTKFRPPTPETFLELIEGPYKANRTDGKRYTGTIAESLMALGVEPTLQEPIKKYFQPIELQRVRIKPWDKIQRSYRELFDASTKFFEDNNEQLDMIARTILSGEDLEEEDIRTVLRGERLLRDHFAKRGLVQDEWLAILFFQTMQSYYREDSSHIITPSNSLGERTANEVHIHIHLQGESSNR